MSGESETESTDETQLQSFKCHICNFKPGFDELVHILSQIFITGPYLVTLHNGHYYVRCEFDDCKRYFHLKCIHSTFPDEALNHAHLSNLRDTGIHCPVCEPGNKIINY